MTTEPTRAADLSRALSRCAEDVCRRYLPAGRRQGLYWCVGDTAGNPGRSLFVRLAGPERGPGAAGKWTDAATGEHGDLLDLIRAACGLPNLSEAMEEARSFLSLPEPSLPRTPQHRGWTLSQAGRIEAARRLFAMARPIPGTPAETYLRRRGITDISGLTALRFHPACYYRDERDVTWRLPALIAAVTDSDDRVMGAHRTWLTFDGSGKAPVATPRRAMGMLSGHGVRLDPHPDRLRWVLAAGEGLETMLALRMALPRLPVVAALSAAHLGALNLPGDIRRLYVAGDGDGPGQKGMERLSRRARDAGIESLWLRPVLGDFNDDLRDLGLAALRLHLLRQLAPGDAVRLIV